MATATAILNTRYKNRNGTYPIVIRISDGKKQHLHNTGYKVKIDQFKNGEVKKHPDAHVINSKIDTSLRNARRYIDDCRERNRKVDFDLIFRAQQSYSFIDYLKHRATQYNAKGQIVMKLKVSRFAKELTECFTELFFDDITQDTLRTFEAWLIKQGNVSNTRHKKFGFLRLFYQQAIDEGKVVGTNPFKLYKIGTTPVKKDKLTPAQIKLIEDLKLNDGPVNDARNLFLFSYYCKGQRFETVVTAQKKDVRNKRIYFLSNKGKKFLSVLIHSRLQSVLDIYREIESPFLFPYIKDIPKDPEKYRQKIGSLNVIVNRNLKKLAELCH